MEDEKSRICLFPLSPGASAEKEGSKCRFLIRVFGQKRRGMSLGNNEHTPGRLYRGNK